MNMFTFLVSTRAKAGESEASGGAVALLVNPAKSQSHFLKSIDDKTVEIQMLGEKKWMKNLLRNMMK